MPKTALVSPEKTTKAILRRRGEIIQKDGSTAKPSHLVWRELEQDLQMKLSAKYLYTIVRENRYSILDKLGVVCRKDTCVSDNSSNETHSSNDELQHTQSFQISVTEKTWNEIKPKQKNLLLEATNRILMK